MLRASAHEHNSLTAHVPSDTEIIRDRNDSAAGMASGPSLKSMGKTYEGSCRCQSVNGRDPLYAGPLDPSHRARPRRELSHRTRSADQKRFRPALQRHRQSRGRDPRIQPPRRPWNRPTCGCRTPCQRLPQPAELSCWRS